MRTLMQSKAIARVLLLCFLGISLHMPAAQAAMIGTEEAITVTQTADRTYLNDVLMRADVADKLQAMGVSANDVQARVNALSDEEAAQLAAQIKDMPAGGDGLGTLVFIFLVLLITDILGFTNVFPFVKKTAR